MSSTTSSDDKSSSDSEPETHNPDLDADVQDQADASSSSARRPETIQANVQTFYDLGWRNCTNFDFESIHEKILPAELNRASFEHLDKNDVTGLIDFFFPEPLIDLILNGLNEFRAVILVRKETQYREYRDKEVTKPELFQFLGTLLLAGDTGVRNEESLFNTKSDIPFMNKDRFSVLRTWFGQGAGVLPEIVSFLNDLFLRIVVFHHHAL